MHALWAECQTTARETEEPEIFMLFEEELGGTRPDRLSDIRPQERVQRRTVEQLVVAAPGLPALDAPVPLVVEQEDARMEQVEDMMFSGQPVSAADREGWRTSRSSSSSSPSSSTWRSLSFSSSTEWWVFQLLH